MWPLKPPRRSAYCDLTESSSGLVSLFEGRSRTACHIRCQTTCTPLTGHHAHHAHSSMCMHDELDKISTSTLLLTFNMPRFAMYGDTCTNKQSAWGKEPYLQSAATLTVWQFIKACMQELACIQAPRRCRFCCWMDFSRL